MALFRYKGRSTRGDAVTGVLEADSADALAGLLLGRGITPVDIQQTAGSQDALGQLWRRIGGGRPQLAELILFSRQMYAITKAGLPLLGGLRSLASSTANVTLRETLRSVIESLEAGRDLTASLSRHPEVFSSFYVSMVRVGEGAGALETVFLRMYEYLSMEKRIREKVKTALRYPMIVMVAIAIAVAIITMWVLPKFAPIMNSLGEKPWATKILLGISAFASEYWYLVLAVVAATIVGFKLWVRKPAGRYHWDKTKLRLPLLGAMVHKAMLARICRSLALTYEAGVPLNQGLNLIARASGNEYLTEKILALRDGVERGEGLHRTAQSSQLFTPLALQMVAVGEETGALGEMLEEVASFYEREVDYDLENMNAALEPVLIVAVGGMVLILALGVFLPLWDMAGSAARS